MVEQCGADADTAVVGLGVLRERKALSSSWGWTRMTFYGVFRMGFRR